MQIPQGPRPHPSPGPASPSPPPPRPPHPGPRGSHRNGKAAGEALKSQKLWLVHVMTTYKQRLRAMASTHRTVQYLMMRIT